MAAINFVKGEQYYTAEFQINGPVNVHIERAEAGALYFRQRSIDHGSYDLINGANWNNRGDLTIDTAIQGVVYPMWIKIESTSEPTLAEMVEGEQSGGGAGESGDWEYYDVSSTVGQDSNASMVEYAALLSGLIKIVEYRDNVIITKKIGPLMYALLRGDYEFCSQIGINMAMTCVDSTGTRTLREVIAQDANSGLAAAYSAISAFPRITKEEFYNLEA